jgi:aspartate 1-decarboxylase
MEIEMLKSKIFRATVTEARQDYEGSVTIDADIMEAVGLLHHEKVLVANFRNGARFETYAIRGPAGSGVICINGAATHLAGVGDEVIIMSFCRLSIEEAERHIPRIVYVDKKNRILQTKSSHVAS